MLDTTLRKEAGSISLDTSWRCACIYVGILIWGCLILIKLFFRNNELNTTFVHLHSRICKKAGQQFHGRAEPHSHNIPLVFLYILPPKWYPTIFLSWCKIKVLPHLNVPIKKHPAQKAGHSCSDVMKLQPGWSKIVKLIGMIYLVLAAKMHICQVHHSLALWASASADSSFLHSDY